MTDTATKNRAETLEQRLSRLQNECSYLTCQATEELEQRYRDAHNAEVEAAKVDDEPARLAARKRIAAILDEQSEHFDKIAAKRLAIATTERWKAENDRANAIRDLVAHAKSASDTAPEVAGAARNLAEVMQRFGGQLNGVYRAARVVDADNEPDWRRATSAERLLNDVIYHLRVALNMPNASVGHAAPGVEQAEEVRRFSETVR
jgi:hypothetical protein